MTSNLCALTDPGDQPGHLDPGSERFEEMMLPIESPATHKLTLGHGDTKLAVDTGP